MESVARNQQEEKSNKSNKNYAVGMEIGVAHWATWLGKDLQYLQLEIIIF